MKKKLRFAKPKKESVSKLKKQAWDTFSKYIRLRDCLKTTGTLEYGTCVTCGKKFHFKNLQAGHFIPGRHNSVLFDEKGVNAQCMACNVYLKGNPVKYFRFMQNAWGEFAIKDLERRDAETKQFKAWELKAIIESYKDLIKELVEL